MDRRTGLLTAAMMVAAAGTARAAALAREGGPAPSAETPHAGSAPQPPRWTPFSGFGMSLAGGGGVTDFTGGAARGVTDVGPSWAIRMAFRTRKRLALEVSYIGGANQTHDLGVGTGSAKLIRNGLEVMMRLNAPLYASGTLLEPYVAAGVGWNGYRITNTPNATAVADPADTKTLAAPVAAGFAFGYRGFIADARFTLRPTFLQSSLRGQPSGALTNWDLGAMLGFEF